MSARAWGFSDYDDNRFHHGLYAFDFFVGDIEVPLRVGRVDGSKEDRAEGAFHSSVKNSAMCHAIVDTWLGETDGRIPFVASMIASVATLELVADVSVDECVFECDLPPGYARSTANKPWEDGSLPIGALDLSLVAPGPLIYVEAGVRYKGQTDRAQKSSCFTGRARDTRDRPCPSRASPTPWHRPCRWGWPWSPPWPPAPE